jgi:hypothetical protein
VKKVRIDIHSLKIDKLLPVYFQITMKLKANGFNLTKPYKMFEDKENNQYVFKQIDKPWEEMMMIYQLKLKKYLDDSISLVSKTPTTLKFKEENTMKSPIEMLKEEFCSRYGLNANQFALDIRLTDVPEELAKEIGLDYGNRYNHESFLPGKTVSLVHNKEFNMYIHHKEEEKPNGWTIIES